MADPARPDPPQHIPLPGQLPLPFPDQLDDDQGEGKTQRKQPARPRQGEQAARFGVLHSAPAIKIGLEGRETFRGFRMVPDSLWLSRELNGSDIKVWCALLFIARGRGFTDATDAAIAAQIGVSDRSVRDSLRRLEIARFIERERRGESRVIILRPEGTDEPIPAFNLKVHG